LAFFMAAAVCFLGAIFSALRGGLSKLPLGGSHLESEELGIAGAGEVAMAQVGAGSEPSTAGR
ncbi:MAG TPA: hypothetical protein VHV79_12265, partial [Mycobacteriales bacterium]|nr:hypothetical protein [Mycobacteriales bacterium]